MAADHSLLGVCQLSFTFQSTLKLLSGGPSEMIQWERGGRQWGRCPPLCTPALYPRLWRMPAAPHTTRLSRHKKPKTKDGGGTRSRKKATEDLTMGLKLWLWDCLTLRLASAYPLLERWRLQYPHQCCDASAQTEASDRGGTGRPPTVPVTQWTPASGVQSIWEGFPQIRRTFTSVGENIGCIYDEKLGW